MPDFIRVAAPVYTPTQCATCSSQHDGEGFLDLLVDLPVSGHLYMCASCVRQAATAMGWTEPRLVAEQAGRLDDERAEVERLKAALEFEREHKTISGADLKAWVERMQGWVPAPDSAVDPLRCPDCGKPKTAGAKRCKPCANKIPSTLGSGSPIPTTAGTTG